MLQRVVLYTNNQNYTIIIIIFIGNNNDRK